METQANTCSHVQMLQHPTVAQRLYIATILLPSSVNGSLMKASVVKGAKTAELVNKCWLAFPQIIQDESS